jgi:hypothetical protein
MFLIHNVHNFGHYYADKPLWVSEVPAYKFNEFFEHYLQKYKTVANMVLDNNDGYYAYGLNYYNNCQLRIACGNYARHCNNGGHNNYYYAGVLFRRNSPQNRKWNTGYNGGFHACFHDRPRGQTLKMLLLPEKPLKI